MPLAIRKLRAVERSTLVPPLRLELRYSARQFDAVTTKMKFTFLFYPLSFLAAPIAFWHGRVPIPALSTQLPTLSKPNFMKFPDFMKFHETRVDET
jgi:hypothetical protein